MSARRLTRNQQLVLDRLRAAERPQGAYALLEGLRDDGLRAPPQVYRALEALVERGLAHRLESVNAFVACRHELHEGACCGAGTEHIVFAICTACGRTEEVADARLAGVLGAVAQRRGFKVDRASVEVQGLCSQCAGDADHQSR